MKRSLWLVLSLCSAAWLTASLAALAEAPPAASRESADYTRTIDQALEEYRLGHFTEARGLFQHAHSLEPSARTLRGLGMVEFELRHYVRASEFLEQALRSPDKPLTSEQRSAVEELLARTRHFLARYRLEVAPPSALAQLEVELDGEAVELSGERTITVSAGEHKLLVSASGYHEHTLQLDAKGGEESTLKVVLKPLTQPVASGPMQERVAPRATATRVTHPYRKAGIWTTSVGGAIWAVGAGLGLAAIVKGNGAPKGSSDEEFANAVKVPADVTISVGLATAVTGVVLLMWKGREQAPPATARVQVESVAPSLRVRF